MKYKQQLLARVLGCLYGQAVGDSIGAGFEFMTARQIQNLHTLVFVDFFKSPCFANHIPGQVTDDTEMARCLSRSIIETKGYYYADVHNRYVAWLNSNPIDIGNTCRAGITGSPSASSESNGTLMRIAPLAIYSLASEFDILVNEAQPVEKAARRVFRLVQSECNQTHLSYTVIWATYIYVQAIRRSLEGSSPTDTYKMCVGMLSRLRRTTPEVEQVYSWISNCDDVWEQPNSNIGHCKVALQYAFSCLKKELPFKEALNRVIRQGGDTDTNGAIVGALLGANQGISGIPSKWVDTIHYCQPSRPEQYWCCNLEWEAEQLLKLIQKESK